MHKLQFRNPVNLKSDNFSTVRLGPKWAERTKPDPSGEAVSVELTDAQGKSLGTAKAVSCWVGPLAEMPAMLLECSHDPVCRTWSGAAQVLAGLHPDGNIDFNTIVTVLQLEYTGSILSIRP